MKALSISIPYRISFLSFLLLLYFATSSADVLNIWVGLYKAKVGHIISFFLFCFFFMQYRMHMNRRILWAAGLFFSSMVISSFYSPYFIRTFGYLVVFLIQFFFYFLLPYNCIYQLEDRQVFRAYFTSFILVGVHAASQLLFSFFGIYIPKVTDYIDYLGSKYPLVRPSAFNYEASFYALYMTSFTAFWNTMYLFSYSFSRSLIGYNVLAGNILLLLSTSSGVLIGYLFFLCVGISFFLFVKNRMQSGPLFKRIFFIFAALFVSFQLMFLASESFMEHYFLRNILMGTKHHSFVIRWRGIVNAWNTFLDYPIFGVGYGGVGPYVYAEKYRRVKVQDISFEDWELLDPTNVCTEVLASQGIVGIFCFLFLIYIFVRDFFRVFSLSSLYQKEKEISFALFVSLVTLILVLQFNQGIFRNYIWIHAALALGYFHKILDRAQLYSSSNT